MIEIAAVLSIIGTLANVGVDIVRYSNNVKGRKMRFRDRLINFFGMSNSMPVNNNYPYAVPTVYPQPWIPTQPIGIVGNNPIMDSRRFQNNNYELPLWDERNECNMMYGTNYYQRQYNGYVGYPYGTDNGCNCYYGNPMVYQSQYSTYNPGYGYNQSGMYYGNPNVYQPQFNGYGYNNQYGYSNNCYYGNYGYNNYGMYYGNPNVYQPQYPAYQYPQYNPYDNYNYNQGNSGYNSIAYPYGDNANNNSQDYWFDPTYGMMPGQVSMNPMNVNMNMNMVPTQQPQCDPRMVSMPQYGQFPVQPVSQQNNGFNNNSQYIDYGYNTPRYQKGKINGVDRRKRNRPIEYIPPTKPFWERVREQELEKMANMMRQQQIPQQRPMAPMMNYNPTPMQTTPQSQSSQSLDSFFEDSAWGMPVNISDNFGSFESNPSSAFDPTNSIRPNGITAPVPQTTPVTPVSDFGSRPITQYDPNADTSNLPPIDPNGPTINGLSVEALFRNTRMVDENASVEDLSKSGPPIATDANGRRYYAGYYPDGIPESVYIDKDPNSANSVIDSSPSVGDGIVSMFSDPNGNPLT